MGLGALLLCCESSTPVAAFATPSPFPVDTRRGMQQHQLSPGNPGGRRHQRRARDIEESETQQGSTKRQQPSADLSRLRRPVDEKDSPWQGPRSAAIPIPAYRLSSHCTQPQYSESSTPSPPIVVGEAHAQAILRHSTVVAPMLPVVAPVLPVVAPMWPEVAPVLPTLPAMSASAPEVLYRPYMQTVPEPQYQEEDIDEEMPPLSDGSDRVMTTSLVPPRLVYYSSIVDGSESYSSAAVVVNRRRAPPPRFFTWSTQDQAASRAGLLKRRIR